MHNWTTTNQTYGNWHQRQIPPPPPPYPPPLRRVPRRRRLFPKMTIKILNNQTKLIVNQTIDLCSICLENMEIGDIVRKTNCNHCYHYKCIDKWFEENRKCPLCNFLFSE